MRWIFAALALASPALAQTSSAYDVTVQRDVMVAMRDGVHLAADVYLPTRNDASAIGRFPTILVRLPYGKDEGLGDSTFVKRGCAVVYQDTRGRFKSEGIWHLLTDDGPDGQDTCRWIAAQPWSDGRIGMMGLSYYGGTQHALAWLRNGGVWD